jgi:uncharacterized membrane protein YfcA
MSVTAIVVLVFVAGIVSGATAMGGAQLVAAGLVLLIDPKMAVILLSLMNLPMAALQVVHHRGVASSLGVLRWLFAPAVVGVPIGLLLLAFVSARSVSVVLGILVLAFVAMNLINLRITVGTRQQRWLAPVVGGIAGIATGLVGVAGPVLATYLVILRLEPARFAYTISLVYLSLSVVRVGGLIVMQELTMPSIVFSALLLVPAIGGQRIGFAAQRRISFGVFRFSVLTLLTVAGFGLLLPRA